MLIVMAGLPGSGKSTIADAVAVESKCAVLSVDPIEAAIWRAGVGTDEPTGLAAYLVAEDLARIQLTLGHDVVVDAVNAAEAAREQWRSLARAHDVALLFVEVFCSNPAEHKRRLEARRRDIPGFYEPTWESVEQRRGAFDDWTDERVRLDSIADHDSNLAVVLEQINRAR